MVSWSATELGGWSAVGGVRTMLLTPDPPQICRTGGACLAGGCPVEDESLNKGGVSIGGANLPNWAVPRVGAMRV